jgi:hypothetical protein
VLAIAVTAIECTLKQKLFAGWLSIIHHAAPGFFSRTNPMMVLSYEV